MITSWWQGALAALGILSSNATAGDFSQYEELTALIEQLEAEKIYAPGELAHEEHAEGAHHAWKHDSPVRVDPFQRNRDRVPGDHEHLGGDNERADDEDEDEPLAGERELRERVAEHATERRTIQDGAVAQETDRSLAIRAR